MPVFAFLGLVFRRLPQHPNHLPVILIFKRTIRGHRLISHTLAAGIVRHSNYSLNVILPVPNRRFHRRVIMQYGTPNINVRAVVQQSADCFRLTGGGSGNERRQLRRRLRLQKPYGQVQ